MISGESAEGPVEQELKRTRTSETSSTDASTVDSRRHDAINKEISPSSSPHSHDAEISPTDEKDPEKGLPHTEQLERTTTSKSHKSSILSRVRSRKSTVQQTTHPETNLDDGIVGWDGQDDPANPINFPRPRKWGLLSLMSAITFVSPLASSMFAPAVGFMGKDFHQSSELLLSFTVSVYLLGYVFGPLFLAPLSEIYGRRIVLTSANAFFVVWQIGCALAPNIESLIIFRFLAGIGGSGCLTLGAGVIADLFIVEERGLATAIWSLGPLFGPAVGPICGGFVAQQVGWRWVFWILLIASVVTTIGIEVLNRETYARVLIRWKTERLAKELNRTDLRSAYAPDATPLEPIKVLQQGLVRPLRMFVKSPIVFLLCVYMALVYGLLYLLFTTITQVFEGQYGFSAQISGLAFLGIGVGFFLGLAAIAATSDRTVIKLTKRNNGKFEPEMRLPVMVFYACFIPISFFWYGWSADKKAHWIVPIIGMVPFSFGMMGIFLPIQTYLIDCFPVYAASAVAILTATRSLVGAILPLAGPPMYKTLGLGWGNSLLGFIAMACIPIPVGFVRWGKIIREKYPVKL